MASPLTKERNEEVRVDSMDEAMQGFNTSGPILHNEPCYQTSKEEFLLGQSTTHSLMPIHIMIHPSAPRSKCKRGKGQISAVESDDSELLPLASGFLRWQRPSNRRTRSTKKVVQQSEKLDTYMFENYLETLWKGFSEEKRSSFTYLDCLWFSLYAKECYREKVLNWIKKKDIFSNKYVFIPIIQWDHWSLLIFCHIGESVESKTRTPCMLLLDSLKMSEPKRFEPGIRKFLCDILGAGERPVNRKLINKIPLLVPKVPQQRNGEECGKFVLYYINLFVESAPESFSIFEGYPYFMNEDWFTHEGYESFCQRLDAKS